MAHKRLRECVTTLDKLRTLLETRNYIENRIESLESDINLNYIRLQQVNETIETLKKEFKKENQEE